MLRTKIEEQITRIKELYKHTEIEITETETEEKLLSRTDPAEVEGESVMNKCQWKRVFLVYPLFRKVREDGGAYFEWSA